MHTAFIGLGSNLNQPQQQLLAAIERLRGIPGIVVETVSPLYLSRPMGPSDQPDFINGAARIRTTLTPHHLLAALKQIESEQGRLKTGHWGPRVIDLDLLLFDDVVMTTDTLKLPHPGITERDFVLRPLLDLDASLTLPDGRSIRECLQACPGHYLEQLLASGGDCQPSAQAIT